MWVNYCVWNFKGYLWNSTQNILPIHWKIRFLYNVGTLRAPLSFKSSYVFLNYPQLTKAADRFFHHMTPMSSHGFFFVIQAAADHLPGYRSDKSSCITLSSEANISSSSCPGTAFFRGPPRGLNTSPVSWHSFPAMDHNIKHDVHAPLTSWHFTKIIIIK